MLGRCKTEGVGGAYLLCLHSQVAGLKACLVHTSFTRCSALAPCSPHLRTFTGRRGSSPSLLQSLALLLCSSTLPSPPCSPHLLTFQAVAAGYSPPLSPKQPAALALLLHSNSLHSLPAPHLCPPFQAVAAGYRPPLSPKLPAALALLLRRCWTAEPAARPNMQEVLQELQEIARTNDLIDLDEVPGGQPGCACCVVSWARSRLRARSGVEDSKD